MSFAQEDAGALERRFNGIEDNKLSPESSLPPIQNSMPPEEASQIRFILDSVKFEGGTIYSGNEILPLYQNLLNKEISLIDIYTLVNDITAKYGKDGYALSRAYVPQQRIKDGSVRIGILEGYIDEALYEGKLKDKRGLVDKYIAKVIAERPISSQTLERYLLLSKDLAGVDIK